MIAIDLEKCFSDKKCLQSVPGLYAFIERGIRAAVCRHCLNPPCVAACPVEALEKPQDGDLIRYPMKCVSCKQCSSACPVGANPPSLLKYKKFSAHKIDIEECKKLLPEGAVEEVDDIQDGWILVDDVFIVKASEWK